VTVDPYEAVAALTGAVAVWLTVRQSVWCWPLGLFNVALYAWVFAQARLYADMGLQVVYAGLCVYGWAHWSRGGPAGGALPVGRTPRGQLAGLALAGALFALGLGRFLHASTDASLPYWDASTTAFSLVAQYLQTRKWIENWPLWIAVDAVYVGIYVAKSLPFTAGLYALFLGLAAVGWRDWRRALAAP
jgi:nicotinamide mononucleotide transporter